MGTVRISLRSRKYPGMVALIDEEDEPKLSGYSWRVDSSHNVNFYARGQREPGGPQILMHRLIMDAPDDRMIDHINRNGLDNRRSNLRFATLTQNNANRGKIRSNSSGLIGVGLATDKKSWRAAIRVENKTIYLGSFPTAAAAAYAYDDAAIRLRGEFAVTNQSLGLIEPGEPMALNHGPQLRDATGRFLARPGWGVTPESECALAPPVEG